jgi:hypothetical protein
LTGNLRFHMSEELQYWDLESLTNSRVDRELAHIENCTQLLWQPPAIATQPGLPGPVATEWRRCICVR